MDRETESRNKSTLAPDAQICGDALLLVGKLQESGSDCSCLRRLGLWDLMPLPEAHQGEILPQVSLRGMGLTSVSCPRSSCSDHCLPGT